jgi:hypothetical protein
MSTVGVYCEAKIEFVNTIYIRWLRVKEMRNKKAAGDDVPREMRSNYWGKAV